MDSGSIAIKKDMSKIHSASYQDNILTFESSDDKKYKLRIIADVVIGLDDLFDACKDRTLVGVTYDNIAYDDDSHPFESVVTYCGGVMEWFAYRSYTFHFDDETCSTIQLSYSTCDATYPEIMLHLEQ